MQVLVNSNHSISVTADLEERVKATVETELERFDDHLTRIEVHLNDENSNKSGPHDKRCQMEARVKGLQPVSVTHKAESLELAIDGAMEKLDKALGHQFGKARAKRNAVAAQPLGSSAASDALLEEDFLADEQARLA